MIETSSLCHFKAHKELLSNAVFADSEFWFGGPHMYTPTHTQSPCTQTHTHTNLAVHIYQHTNLAVHIHQHTHKVHIHQHTHKSRCRYLHSNGGKYRQYVDQICSILFLHIGHSVDGLRLVLYLPFSAFLLKAHRYGREGNVDLRSYC